MNTEREQADIDLRIEHSTLITGTPEPKAKPIPRPPVPDADDLRRTTVVQPDTMPHVSGGYRFAAIVFGLAFIVAGVVLPPSALNLIGVVLGMVLLMLAWGM